MRWMSRRQSALPGSPLCEKLRDESRQEETGREEAKKHFKEVVTRLGDSPEKGAKGRELLPARERGLV